MHVPFNFPSFTPKTKAERVQCVIQCHGHILFCRVSTYMSRPDQSITLHAAVAAAIYHDGLVTVDFWFEHRVFRSSPKIGSKTSRFPRKRVCCQTPSGPSTSVFGIRAAKPEPSTTRNKRDQERSICRTIGQFISRRTLCTYMEEIPTSVGSRVRDIQRKREARGHARRTREAQKDSPRCSARELRHAGGRLV